MNILRICKLSKFFFVRLNKIKSNDLNDFWGVQNLSSIININKNKAIEWKYVYGHVEEIKYDEK